MACSTSSAACFSGRTTTTTPFTHARGRPQAGWARRREHCAAAGVRGSLEEEFKKHCLRLSSSNSSSQERLKDLSGASLYGDLGGSGSPDAAAGPSSSAQPPPGAGFEDTSAPFTANLPLSSEPYHPLEFYPTSQIDLDWGSGVGSGDEAWLLGAAAGSSHEKRSRCFVILFGVGRAETEGIYSLRAVGRDDGLPVDTIVAFENEDDALRYSTLLEATMDHEPTVWPIEWGELLEFCNSAGYRCRLEPAGSLLIPPDYNVGMTDWEKSLKLRKGEFSVLGAEPAPAGGGAPTGSLFLDGSDWVYESAPVPMQEDDDDDAQAAQLNAVIDSQLSSPAAVEAIRASLERLLPRE